MQFPNGCKVVGQGPTVVLLHSSLSSSKQWQLLVNLLKSNFTVINIDILGYGDADDVVDPDSYCFDVEVARIRKIIKLATENSQYHLVGHSCGGAIAMKLAVEAPQNVLSMSLFEPVAFHLLPIDSRERAESDSFAEKVNIDDQYKAAECFTDFWNKPGFFIGLPEKMKRLMAADMPKVNLDFKGLISEKYHVNDVAKITSPVLYMVGQSSPHLSHYLSNLITSSLPNVHKEVFNCGHMGPISHQSEIIPAINSFIRAL